MIVTDEGTGCELLLSCNDELLLLFTMGNGGEVDKDIFCC